MSLVNATETFLTAKQLEHRLGISPMTVVNWRKGSPSHRPLPHITTTLRKGAGFLVRYPLSQVAAWLRMYKPTMADLIYQDRCPCKHCKKMTDISDVVASHATDVEILAEEMKQSA